MIARGTAALAVGLTVVLATGACTGGHDVPTIGAPGAAASASGSALTAPAATAGPTADVARAETERELTRFDAVNRGTVRRVRAPGGRAFIDGLVAAGYRRADMQVTEDRTTIGLPVPSVQFSVLWRGVCLIGQHGPESGGYRSVVAEPVGGRCLIGRTRPIDW